MIQSPLKLMEIFPLTATGSGSSPKHPSVFIPFKKEGIHSPHVSVPHIYCQQTSGKRMPSSASRTLTEASRSYIYRDWGQNLDVKPIRNWKETWFWNHTRQNLVRKQIFLCKKYKITEVLYTCRLRRKFSMRHIEPLQYTLKKTLM